MMHEEEEHGLVPAISDQADKLQNQPLCDQLEGYIVQALPSVRDIFAPLPHDIPSESLTRFQEGRAESLAIEFKEMTSNFHYNLVTLGWMIIQTSLYETYKYAPGYHGESLKEWVCLVSRMHPSVYDHAYEIGKAWQFLRDAQVPLAVLTDERFSLKKARVVNKLKTDANRQIRIREEKMRDALAEEEEQDTKALEQAASAAFFADVQTEVIHLLELSDHDLDLEVARAHGQRERPVFYLRDLEYRNGRITGRVESLCSIEELEVLREGKYTLAFCLKGKPGYVSPRQLGEFFCEQEAGNFER